MTCLSFSLLNKFIFCVSVNVKIDLRERGKIFEASLKFLFANLIETHFQVLFKMADTGIFCVNCRFFKDSLQKKALESRCSIHGII